MHPWLYTNFCPPAVRFRPRVPALTSGAKRQRAPEGAGGRGPQGATHPYGNFQGHATLACMVRHVPAAHAHRIVQNCPVRFRPRVPALTSGAKRQRAPEGAGGRGPQGATHPYGNFQGHATLACMVRHVPAAHAHRIVQNCPSRGRKFCEF